MGLKVDQPGVSPTSSTLTSESENGCGIKGEQQKQQQQQQNKQQQLYKSTRRGSSDLLPVIHGKFRHRSSTSAAKNSTNLSRHLSSSCLIMSRSTSSLRKALSAAGGLQRTRGKSRSMNLRRDEIPWSNSDDDGEDDLASSSSSGDSVIEKELEEGSDLVRRQNNKRIGIKPANKGQCNENEASFHFF